MCNFCQSRQYCEDCIAECDQSETKESRKFIRKVDRLNEVSIEGNFLIYNGRSHKILKSEETNSREKKEHNPNLKIKTKDGLIFRLRRKGGKFLLLKTTKEKELTKPVLKTGQRYNYLIGRKLPQELKTDLNW